MKYLVLSLLGLVCLACSTPGETRASYTLQGDIQSMINTFELADGHSTGGRVVDTKVVSVSDSQAVEDWYVARGDHRVVYRVTMVPSPQGGTDFRVEPLGDEKPTGETQKPTNP